MTETLHQKRRRAGRLGGLATVARHGPGHMRRIGQRGAQVTHSRYTLQPVGLSGWALVDRATGKIKTTWS